jgi:hypothetical protein
MKFSMFKKDKKNAKQADAAEEDGVELTDLEEELNNRTSSLKEKQRQLESLSDSGENPGEIEEETVAPHGPIEELSVEPSDQPGTPEQPILGADGDVPSEDSGEEINVVEVKAEKVPVNQEVQPETPPPPPPEEKKDEGVNQNFNSLFQSEEEEENPLANLIKRLPDVSADELVKDLNEIKDIIKEWQKKT